MAVRIRLSRVGTNKTPSYRVVAADSRKKRDGRILELLGQYDPRGAKSFHVNRERVDYWISKGAQPTQTVAELLKKASRSS